MPAHMQSACLQSDAPFAACLHSDAALLQLALTCLKVVITGPGQPRYNTWLLIKLMPKGVVFSFVVITGDLHEVCPAFQGPSCTMHSSGWEGSHKLQHALH